MTDLNIAEFTKINVTRAERWHPGFPHDGRWNGADWSNAMCGEAGEAANVVKKLRRLDEFLVNTGDPDQDSLIRALGDEIADVFTYLNLLAVYYGIDMASVIKTKFNIVSERHGFPERI